MRREWAAFRMMIGMFTRNPHVPAAAPVNPENSSYTL